MTNTERELQQDILNKIDGLKNYVDRMATTLRATDMSKPIKNIDDIDNNILMIQGQKEFVKMAIQEMEKACKK